MRWYALLSLAPVVLATLNLHHLRSGLADRQQKGSLPVDIGASVSKRQSTPKFLNDKTSSFAVNGTAIPLVNFDVGESYAGSLSIGDVNDTNQLYFWFFPSTNDAADKEITLWLTGGPGCSSTGELLSENGPFVWQPGMFSPVQNKWSWHTLSNVVWVDQPIGAGFSQGNVTARDEFDVAKQFMGFWKNFIDLFSMQGYKVYITGSSYSGMYCPYIASAMLDADDKNYFNVSGMQIFDGLYSTDALAEEIPVVAFADNWQSIFGFNDSFAGSVRETADRCGYTDYLSKYLVFPPVGVQPSVLPGQNENGSMIDDCDAFTSIFLAANEVNSCFSPYTITQLCPIKYDPLGFADGTMFIPEGSGPAYFNRPDVKAAINAPDKEWVFCSNDPVFVDGVDNSLLGGPGSQPVIPNVIDKTQNVILGHGSQDFVLMSDGTLLSIQNMTFGGKLGFQARPSAPLFVPYHENTDFTSVAGAGVIGTTHTERGLTYFAVGPAGHFLAMDAPAVAYRSLEVLLGRVDSLQSATSFTTEVNSTAQPTESMGNGTVLIADGGVFVGDATQFAASETSEALTKVTSSGCGKTMAWTSLLGITIAWTVLLL